MKRLSKGFKRFLVGLTAATMIFGTVGSAFAAEYSDVDANSNVASSIQRLSSLNIFEGFPDGTFRPGDTVTRAQFAAVAVRAMGLEAAAGASAGSTQFPDVNSSHWASGYINVAVSQGLIEGYPDGNYRPENQVTHAESLAILVRMLGYEHLNLPGAWPAKYIAKAAELGLTKGVTLSANLPATRGELALMTDNSLTVPMVIQAGSDNQWIVSGTQNTDERTLLGDRLDMVEHEDATITANWLTDTSLDEDEVRIVDENGAALGVFTVVSGTLNPLDLLGVRADVWVDDDDDELFAASITSGVSVFFDKVDGTTTAAAVLGDEITLDDADDVDVSANADIFLDYEALAGADSIATGLWGRFVKTDGEITLIELFAFGNNDAWVIDSVDAEDEIIRASNRGANRTLRLNNEDYVVRSTSGAVNSLEDIEKGDVIAYVQDDNDVYQIWVARDVVEGELTRLKAGTGAALDLFIDGKKYDNGPNAGFSLNGGEDVDDLDNPGDVDDAIGEEVLVRLDVHGDVAYLEANSGSAASWQVGYIVSTFRTGADYVRLVNADGKKVTYEYTDDTNEDNPAKEWNFAVYDATDADTIIVVRYKLATDGTLDEIVILDHIDATDTSVTAASNATGNTAAQVTVEVTDLDDDEDTITVDDTGANGENTYYVSEKSVVYEWGNNDADDPDVISWSTIRDANPDDQEVALYMNPDVPTEVLALVITDAAGASAFGADEETAIVLDRWYDGDWQVKLALFDGDVIEQIEVQGGQDAGTLINYADIITYAPSSGEVDDVQQRLDINEFDENVPDVGADQGPGVVKTTTDAEFGTVVDVDGSFVDLGAGYIRVSSRAVIYDVTAGWDDDNKDGTIDAGELSPLPNEIKAAELSDVSVGDLIIYVRDGANGPIQAILIAR